MKDLADVVEGPLHLSFVFFDKYRGNDFGGDSEVQVQNLGFLGFRQ